MERREWLKAAGTVGAAAAAGGLGTIAFGGTTAAAELEASDPVTATTDDGEIKYVAYGGKLVFTWDGLDTEAQYGGYAVESRIQRDDDSWTSWVSHGSASGPLGDDPDNGHDGDGEFEIGEGNSADSWGGSNDSNTGTGTDGTFTFRFGSPHGQEDYAIVGDGSQYSGVRAVPNYWETSRVEVDTDGESKRTNVQIRKTCRVYDGDPTQSGTSKLIEASDTALLPVTVENRPAEGDTSGNVEGTIGADES